MRSRKIVGVGGIIPVHPSMSDTAVFCDAPSLRHLRFEKGGFDHVVGDAFSAGRETSTT